MKLYLMDMDEATKHESSRNIGHPAMTWPFSMLVTGRIEVVQVRLIYLRILYLVIRMNMCKEGRKVGLATLNVMI